MESVMNAWRRLLLAVVCGVAVSSIYAAQPVLEPMGRDLGLSPELTGWIVATGQLGYLVGLVLLVPLGDVADRRRLIAVHLALTALGLLLTSLASTTWMAIVGLAVAGLFAVVVQTTVAYAASASPSAERGRNIGVVTSGVVAGILGARVVTGTLAEVAGWRSVYAVLAVLSLGLAALVLAVLPQEERPPRTSGYGQAVASLGGLFKDRTLLTRGLIAFFLFASFGTLWSGLALPLAGSPWQLSESQIGLFGIAGLAGALGAARAGRWADAGRAAPVTGLALTLLILSWATIAQLPWSLWLLVVGVILLDFAVQAVHVSSQHQLAVVHADRTSSVIGSYMVFYSLGSALGAAATTALFTTYGWSGASLLGAAFAACALAVWAVDRRIPQAAPRRSSPPRPRRAPSTPTAPVTLRGKCHGPLAHGIPIIFLTALGADENTAPAATPPALATMSANPSTPGSCARRSPSSPSSSSNADATAEPRTGAPTKWRRPRPTPPAAPPRQDWAPRGVQEAFSTSSSQSLTLGGGLVGVPSACWPGVLWVC